MNNVRERVIEQLRAKGLRVDCLEVDTSDMVRVPVEGDKGGRRSGYYRCYEHQCSDGKAIIFGYYGNWRSGLEGQKITYSDSGLDSVDRAALSKKVKQSKEDSLRDRQRKATEAAANAVRIWERLTEGKANNSPYLLRKKVEAFGIRFSGEDIAVPVKTVEGELVGLQFIQADGSKRFTSGTAKSGAMHLIGLIDSEKPLLIAEGYATAASCHKATVWPCVVGFDAGNLPKVTEALRAKYPKLPIVIAADNDAAGLKYAKVASSNYGTYLAKPTFRQERSGAVDFNDLAVAEGLETVKLQLSEALMRDKPQAIKQRPQEIIERVSGVHGDFILNDAGLYFKKDGDEERRWLCARLEVLGRSRDEVSNSWGLLLKVRNFDGEDREINLSSSMLVGQYSRVLEALLNVGLKISPINENKKKISEYFQGHGTNKRVRLINKYGWNYGAFVLPNNDVIGTPDEYLHYYNDHRSLNNSATKGSLDEWKENVSAYCQGNPLLTLCVSMAFAGPILEWLGVKTFGVHLVGESGGGKTTAAVVAASVCGGKDYVRLWNSTSSALESICAQHSDSLLVLDEIGQADASTIGSVVYMLANEAGRARSIDTGMGTRAQQKWRLVLLSNGEKALEEFMAAAGQKVNAGQEVRLLNIQSCNHKGAKLRASMAIYNNLHGFGHSSELSVHLQSQAREYHGAPFKAYLQYLASLCEEERKQLTADMRRDIDSFLGRCLSGGSGGQANRAGTSFAVIGLAGELATHAGITGWRPGEALAAAETHFGHWLAGRGGEGNREDRELLLHIANYLLRKQEICFRDWRRDDATVDTHQPRMADCLGWRRVHESKFELGGAHSDVTLYIYPSLFEKEVCKGYSHTRALELLYEKNVLQTTKGRRFKKKINIPWAGKKATDVYCISLSDLHSLVSEPDGEDGVEETVAVVAGA